MDHSSDVAEAEEDGSSPDSCMHRGFDRREVQKYFSISPSSAKRLISDWRGQGVVEDLDSRYRSLLPC